jgi:tyrosine-protein phosphatase YwqE
LPKNTLFFFKKKNPQLHELIPTDFVDIHSHLIPGIDDGSKSVADSLSMMTSLCEIGFSQFITTPHIFQNVWNNTPELIQREEAQLKITLQNNEQLFEIKAAAEYMLDNSISTRLESEKLLTLKDNMVLVEMSYLNPPIQLFDLLYEIQIAGYSPVIAHPERYLFYHNNMEIYAKLKKAGCLFQLNLLSAVGYYGLGVTKAADTLLKKGFIDFVGSDVHHVKHVEAFQREIIVKEMTSLKEAIQQNQLFRFL